MGSLSRPGMGGDRWLLADILSATNAIADKLGSCLACQNHVQTFGEGRRWQLWNDLPSIFDCPTTQSPLGEYGGIQVSEQDVVASSTVGELPLLGSTVTLSNLRPHKDFWFDDGNVVLAAQRTAFKVYRGLLATHSTVFSRMFQASSQDESETLDGSSVIRLPDSSQDVTHFLEVLIPLKSSRQ